MNAIELRIDYGRPDPADLSPAQPAANKPRKLRPTTSAKGGTKDA